MAKRGKKKEIKAVAADENEDDRVFQGGFEILKGFQCSSNLSESHLNFFREEMEKLYRNSVLRSIFKKAEIIAIKKDGENNNIYVDFNLHLSSEQLNLKYRSFSLRKTLKNILSGEINCFTETGFFRSLKLNIKDLEQVDDKPAETEHYLKIEYEYVPCSDPKELQKVDAKGTLLQKLLEIKDVRYDPEKMVHSCKVVKSTIVSGCVKYSKTRKKSKPSTKTDKASLKVKVLHSISSKDVIRAIKSDDFALTDNCKPAKSTKDYMPATKTKKSCLKDNHKLSTMSENCKPATKKACLKDNHKFTTMTKNSKPATKTKKAWLKNNCELSTMAKNSKPATNTKKSCLKDSRKLSTMTRNSKPATKTKKSCLKDKHKLSTIAKNFIPATKTDKAGVKGCVKYSKTRKKCKPSTKTDKASLKVKVLHSKSSKDVIRAIKSDDFTLTDNCKPAKSTKDYMPATKTKKSCLKDNHKLSTMSENCKPATKKACLKDNHKFTTMTKNSKPATKTKKAWLKDNCELSTMAKNSKPATNTKKSCLKDSHKLSTMTRNSKPATKTKKSCLKDKHKLSTIAKNFIPATKTDKAGVKEEVFKGKFVAKGDRYDSRFSDTHSDIFKEKAYTYEMKLDRLYKISEFQNIYKKSKVLSLEKKRKNDLVVHFKVHVLPVENTTVFLRNAVVDILTNKMLYSRLKVFKNLEIENSIKIQDYSEYSSETTDDMQATKTRKASLKECVFKCSIQVIKGDKYDSSLADSESIVYQEKINSYKKMLEKLFRHSGLRSIFKKLEILSFNKKGGSNLYVYFVIHLSPGQSSIFLQKCLNDILSNELKHPRTGLVKDLKISKKLIQIQESGQCSTTRKDCKPATKMKKVSQKESGQCSTTKKDCIPATKIKKARRKGVTDSKPYLFLNLPNLQFCLEKHLRCLLYTKSFLELYKVARIRAARKQKLLNKKRKLLKKAVRPRTSLTKTSKNFLGGNKSHKKKSLLSMGGTKRMKQHNTSSGVHQGSPPLKKRLLNMDGKKGMKQHNTSAVHQGGPPLKKRLLNMDGKKGMKQHNTSAVHQGGPPLKKSLQSISGKKGMKQHNTSSGVHQGRAPLGKKYIKSNKRKKILEASGYPICGFLRTSVNLNEAHKNIPQHKALLHFGGLVPDISSKDIGVPDENNIWSPVCENFIEYQEETMYKFSDDLIYESQDLLKESLNIYNYFKDGSFPNTAEELKNFMTWLDALEAHDLVDSNEELAHSNNELSYTKKHIMKLNENAQIKQNADLVKANEKLTILNKKELLEPSYQLQSGHEEIVMPNDIEKMDLCNEEIVKRKDENNSQFKHRIEKCEELLEPSDKEINLNDLEDERNSKFTHMKESVELLEPSDQVELGDEELNLNDDEVTKRSDEINGESTQHIETCEKLVEPRDEEQVKSNDIEVVDLSDDEVPERSAKSNEKFARNIEESKKRDERDREFVRNWVEKKTATQHRKDCEKLCKPCGQVEPRDEEQVKSSDIEVVDLSDDEVSERDGESNEEFTQDIENSVKWKPSDVELSHNNMEELKPSDREIIKKNDERNSKFIHMKECKELLEPCDQVELGDEKLNLNDVEEMELNADEVTKRGDESNGESTQHIETPEKLLEPRDEEQVKSNDIEVVDLSDDEVTERNDESDEEFTQHFEKSEKWKPSDEELSLNDIEEVEMSDKEVTKRNEESNKANTQHEEFESSYEKLSLNDIEEREPSDKKIIIKRNDERGGKFTQAMKECEELLEPRDEELNLNDMEEMGLNNDEIAKSSDESNGEFTPSIETREKLLEPRDEETERSDESDEELKSWYESKVKDFKLAQRMKECEKLLQPRDEEQVKSNDIEAADLSDDEVMEITDEKNEEFTQSINICCAERCVNFIEDLDKYFEVKEFPEEEHEIEEKLFSLIKELQLTSESLVKSKRQLVKRVKERKEELEATKKCKSGAKTLWNSYESHLSSDWMKKRENLEKISEALKDEYEKHKEVMSNYKKFGWCAPKECQEL